MNTSLLQQELEPLNAQTGQAQAHLKALERELRGVEAELESLSGEEPRFAALRRICDGLGQLAELEAGALFWDGLGSHDPADHVARLRGRIARFDEEVRGARERRESLAARIEGQLDELYDLHEEIRQAHAREERRQEEFVVEREISPVGYRPMLMPWTASGQSEKRFRRILAAALLWSFLLGYLVPLVNLPLVNRQVVVAIPERLVTLVKKEPPRPEPRPRAKQPDRPQEEKVAEATPKKPDPKKQEPKPVPNQPQVASARGGEPSPRKKAESTGVLAFKSTFTDLMDETPVAKLGTEARLSKSPQAEGQARATRSLVAMQAQGGSGGIGNAAFSRNLGGGSGGGTGVGRGGGGGGGGNGNGIGGVGVARVASAVAGLAGEKGRPLSGGLGPARTDEEIQIVFDRYKAALYRIYNTELRKDPTLRGKILLRLTIEPGGEVSMCKAEATDLASPELVANIVERVKRFNFGPKEGVPKTTILYPIDFLPAG